jgi:hypothetical protein
MASHDSGSEWKGSFGGADPGDEDELGGPDPGEEDVLGGPDPGSKGR